jgi:methionyl-tRNA formyltransferase
VTRLRTVFMGTPDIAVPSLRALAQATEVTCVITQPDRPAGRGQREQEPPVKSAARALGLPVWQPETLKGQGSDPRLACDLAVVLAYGELLRQDALDAPRWGCVNLHASLLPRWRGASPLQAALRAGDRVSGVTVMRMVRALDAGPMWLTEGIEIGTRTTLPELHDRLAEAAARALERFLASWPPSEPTPQDDTAATICRKLTPEDGRLDFARPAEELERWVRAYTPAPGCWTLLAHERARVLALEPRPGASWPGAAPGALARVGDALLVACADGAVAVERLQPAGKRAMSASEYLNGHRLPERVG